MEDIATSTALLQGILDASPDAITVYQAVRDVSGRIMDMRLTMLNERSAQILGIESEIVVNRLFSELAPAAVREERFGWLRQVAETGEPFERELHAVLPNNGDAWIQASVRRFDEYVIITYRDISERKRLEQERYGEQKLLESVFNNLYLGIAHYEAVREGNFATGPIIDFRMKRANDVAVQRTGYSRSAVVGRLITEINPAHRSSGMFDRFVAVCTTGEPFQTEMYYPQFSGWFELAVTKLGDGVVVTSNDITERKQIEQRSQDEMSLLQTVVDNAPVGIILAEAIYGQGNQAHQIIDFCYRLTNTFNAEQTGHTVEAMNGRAISELFPGWQTMSLFKTMTDVIQTGQPQQYTEEYDRYGIRAWFEYYFCKLGNSVLLTFSDVSKLKEAAQAVEQQAETLETILDNSQTAISLHQTIRDEHNRIIDFRTLKANRQAIAMWEPYADLILSKTFLEVAESVNQQEDLPHFAAVVETGEPMLRELRIGNHWYLQLTAKSGDGVVISFIDVTENRQYQQQLEMANRELARSNDNLQSFAYVASHDLQEPLRKIESFGNLLSEQYASALGDSGRMYIDRMQNSARRMSLLIKDLLAYSRLATQPEPFEPVALGPLLSEVLDDLSVAVHEANATLLVDELPTVSGDRMQLRQLVQNLLSNALKFRRSDAALTINVGCTLIRPTDRPELPLSAVHRRYYEISVRDNGIGFDQKYSEQIFRVFERLHSKHQYSGTGVGLSITKRVAENHGGAISVQSQPGQGTTFHVYLPA